MFATKLQIFPSTQQIPTFQVGICCVLVSDLMNPRERVVFSTPERVKNRNPSMTSAGLFQQSK